MTPRIDTEIKTLANDYRGLTAPAIQSKQEREQALEWVSHNALSSVREKWCKARLNDRRTK